MDRLLDHLLARANAQQKNGHARSFRRARQTQGRREIERARRAENFDQRRAQTFAASRFDAGAQHRLGVPAAHQRQNGGIDAEFGKPHAIQPPGLAFQKILPRPEQRSSRRGAQGHGEAETGGGGPIGAPGRMDLMQAGATEPAAKESVDAGRAQSETRGAIRRGMAVVAGLGEETPQDGQGFRPRRRSPSLRIDPLHGVFAQMFLLCSIQQTPKARESQAGPRPPSN